MHLGAGGDLVKERLIWISLAGPSELTNDITRDLLSKIHFGEE